MNNYLIVVFTTILLTSCLKTAVIESQENLTLSLDSTIIEKELYDNDNNLGIWEIDHFINDFGEQTDDQYVKAEIAGLFSNFLSDNSPLKVKFLISNKTDISFELYEYAQDAPVIDNSFRSVIVRDKDGLIYKLKISNRSGKITFLNSNYYDESSEKTLEKSHCSMMFRILQKGGNIKFKVAESSASTSTYNFEIGNADLFEKAFDQIQTKSKRI